MAHQMTVLYHHPDDPAAFDAYYESTHAPLTATLPGLRSYDVLRPLPNPGEDRPAYPECRAQDWRRLVMNRLRGSGV